MNSLTDIFTRSKYYSASQRIGNLKGGKESKKVRVGLLLLLTTLVSGCITIYNPATQRREIYFIDDNSEILIGKNLATQILKQEKKVVRDKTLLLWVRNIGEKIAKVCDRNYLQYNFYILDKKEMNAFALPGGYVFVNRGLVEKTNKDELAFCLGHEIGHICARHPVKRLQVSLGWNLLLTLALKGTKYADIKRGIDVIYNIIALGYSREDEFLADSLGVKYAYKAGFNPYGAISLLEKLRREGGEDNSLVFLRSHPPINRRIENVKEKIKEIKN